MNHQEIETNDLLDIAKKLDLKKLIEFDESIQKSLYMAAAQQHKRPEDAKFSVGEIVTKFKKDKDFMTQYYRHEAIPVEQYKENRVIWKKESMTFAKRIQKHFENRKLEGKKKWWPRCKRCLKNCC